MLHAGCPLHAHARFKEAQRKFGRVAGYRDLPLLHTRLSTKLCPLARGSGKRMKDHAGARYTEFHDERDNLAMISSPIKT